METRPTTVSYTHLEIIIMKNLKKLTALAGICAVTVASLAACGQSGTTTETKADTNAAQTEAGSQAAESTADSCLLYTSRCV